MFIDLTLIQNFEINLLDKYLEEQKQKILREDLLIELIELSKFIQKIVPQNNLDNIVLNKNIKISNQENIIDLNLNTETQHKIVVDWEEEKTKTWEESNRRSYGLLSLIQNYDKFLTTQYWENLEIDILQSLIDANIDLTEKIIFEGISKVMSSTNLDDLLLSLYSLPSRTLTYATDLIYEAVMNNPVMQGTLEGLSLIGEKVQKIVDLLNYKPNSSSPVSIISSSIVTPEEKASSEAMVDILNITQSLKSGEGVQIRFSTLQQSLLLNDKLWLLHITPPEGIFDKTSPAAYYISYKAIDNLITDITVQSQLQSLFMFKDNFKNFMTNFAYFIKEIKGLPSWTSKLDTITTPINTKYQLITKSGADFSSNLLALDIMSYTLGINQPNITDSNIMVWYLLKLLSGTPEGYTFYPNDYIFPLITISLLDGQFTPVYNIELRDCILKTFSLQPTELNYKTDSIQRINFKLEFSYNEAYLKYVYNINI